MIVHKPRCRWVQVACKQITNLFPPLYGMRCARVVAHVYIVLLKIVLYQCFISYNGFVIMDFVKKVFENKVFAKMVFEK